MSGMTKWMGIIILFAFIISFGCAEKSQESKPAQGKKTTQSKAEVKKQPEPTVKDIINEFGTGLVFTLDSHESELDLTENSVKTEKEAPLVFKALQGKNENEVIKAMKAANIKYVAVPKDLDEDYDKWGTIFEALVHAGELNLLSILLIDDETVLAGITAEAYQCSDADLKAALAYVRKSMKGEKDLPKLPESFAKDLVQKAIVDVRFTDSIGYNKSVGVIRGRGTTLKGALSAASSIAKSVYDKKGSGRSTVEPFEMWLDSTKITLNIYRERGFLGLPESRIYKHFAPGLDGVIMKFANGDKDLTMAPYKSKIYKKGNVNKLFETAAKRYKKEPTIWKKDTTQLYKFRTVDVTERKPAGEIIRLFRGVEFISPEEITYEESKQGFVDGADWLLSILDHDKKMFEYEYFAVSDRYRKGRYNIIRHCLATLTLIQAYEITKEKRYLEGGRVAIEWVLSLLEWEGKMAYFRHPKFDRKYKLGGAGTLIQAMCEYVRFEKKPEWDKPMKGIGEFMMQMIKDNGHYRSFYTKPGKKEDNGEVTIYPGEANLALVRLYKLYKDKRYLDTVSKAFTYYSEWFDDKKNPNSKGSLGAFVPWEMSAMMEFWEVTKRDDVAKYAYDMADWVLDNWYVFDQSFAYWKDYVGGYHGAKRKLDLPLWNSGVYGEGIGSVYYLAKLRGDKARMEKYRKATLLTIGFIRNLQYREGSDYYLPQPAKAIGAIPSTFHKDDCRLDYAYHCLTVNYRALRFFDKNEWKALGAK